MSKKEEANLEKDIEAHLNWMQSLIADGGAASSGQGAADGFTAQVDDLIASIQAPSDKQPKISDVCQQYSSLTKDAYGSVDPSPLTPAAAAAPAKPTKQYRISDPVNSDDDSDCEDYYVEDAAEIRGQEIPDWARAANLLVELQKQQTVDPDKIFTNFERTCDLSQMFEKKKRTFKVRGDSGWWANDGLTPAEEVNYKKAVGLA